MKKIKLPLLFIRLFHYEYWDWYIFYLPMIPYWIYLSIRSRSPLFFTAVNRSILYGGFFGENKYDILKLIPDSYKPWTILIQKSVLEDKEINSNNYSDLKFPCIVKPVYGERGFKVEKIENLTELTAYHHQSTYDYIIQEYLDMPVEVGVFYYRLPGELKGRVTSVTLKDFLTVTGDGTKNVEALMMQSDRARFQIRSLKINKPLILEYIPAKDEKYLIEPIGNHCRGTRFINANHLINERMHDVFDAIAKQIPGFDYGRFDLKVSSIDDLYIGNSIRIMELNGASSDPTHIYDASTGLLNAYADLANHWKAISVIADSNMQLGVKPAKVSLLLNDVKKHFRNKISS